MHRDCRGRAANERLSQHRVVPGDPHNAQTSAVRPQSGVWALECALALALRERFSVRLPPPKSYQYLAKLTRARRSFKARPKTFETKRAPLPSAAPPCARLACTRRLTRATSPPRHHHAPRCCVLLWQGTRAGHGSAHVTAGTDVPAGSALTNLQRDRGSFPTTIGVRAVSRTRCLCAQSPAASRVSPAVAAPNQRRPCAQDGRASLT